MKLIELFDALRQSVGLLFRSPKAKAHDKLRGATLLLAADAIQACFTWENTPQGAAYWVGVTSTLRAIAANALTEAGAKPKSSKKRKPSPVKADGN